MEIKAKGLVLTLHVEKATATKPAFLVLRDQASSLDFVKAELHPTALESLLYGNAVDLQSTVFGVGKYLGCRKVVESRTVRYFGSNGDDVGTISRWVVANKQEPGWFVDPDVRPSDIILLGGQLHITYHVFKFVKP